jgi:Zn-dependent protease
MDEWELEFGPVKTGDQPWQAPEEVTPPEGPPPNPADDRVLAAIDRLQRQKANWLTTLLTVIVSGALFYGIGAAAWSWKLPALLIPILLFHELGHYVAMLVFRYRNVRMFFIPLFGAAVIGRHYNVPAWKKAVVSLMGPLPGIAVGTALGIAAIILKHKLMLEVATTMVFLNGFNLLPILPLDGGWTLHALVFSRHVLLDVGFRVVTALALIGGSFAPGLHFMLYLGIAMLMAIPAAYRMATIAARLRQEQVMAQSLDSESIPEETARQIIGEIRIAFPRRMTDKNYARLTMQIFEALNSRPAGWIATLLLGGAHLLGFVVALLAACLFFVASRTDLGQFFREAVHMPQNIYTCGSTLRTSGPAGEVAIGQPITLIGNFASETKARSAYNELTAAPLPPDVAVTWFGQTVFVTLPRNDELRGEWEGKLRPLSREYQVADARSLAFWTLVCIAADEHDAEGIEQEANSYLLVGTRLIPPWSTTSKLKPDERKARQTYAKLVDANHRLQRSHIADFQKEVSPKKTIDRAEWDQLQQDADKSRRDAAKKAVEEVRREGEGAIDLELTRLYEAWNLPPKNENADEHNKVFDRLIERMGAVPKEAAKSRGGDDRESTRFGHVTRTGLLLRFDSLAFKSAGDGLPALAEWLCSQKCIAIKYRLRSLPGTRVRNPAPVDIDDDN